MRGVTAQGIPYLSFCGYSGSGKTTLLSHLIPGLKKQGLRLAVVKHDRHEFDMDHPGTDTDRFAQAGADIAVIASPTQLAYLEKCRREPSVFDIIDKIFDVDLILIEGYKRERLPKILVSREGVPLPGDIPRELVLAQVTDTPHSCEAGYPVFSFTQIKELIGFILNYIKTAEGL